MNDLIENVTGITKDIGSKAPVLLISAALSGAILWVLLLLSQDNGRERAELRAERAELIEQLIQCHELRAVSGQNDTKP